MDPRAGGPGCVSSPAVFPYTAIECSNPRAGSGIIQILFGVGPKRGDQAIGGSLIIPETQGIRALIPTGEGLAAGRGRRGHRAENSVVAGAGQAQNFAALGIGDERSAGDGGVLRRACRIAGDGAGVSVEGIVKQSDLPSRWMRGLVRQARPG